MRARAAEWGADLSDDEFACAVAAAGVAAAGGDRSGALVPWPWRDPFAGRGVDGDARSWLRAWRQWTTWPWPRLAIAPDTEDPAAVSALLRRCSWPFVPMTAGTPAPSWRFPIRIGVLDTDSGRSFRAALIAAFAGSAWREHLIEPLVVGRERVRCDILVLPEPSSFDGHEVRAATVLAGGLGSRPEDLANRTGAWAVGVGARAPGPDEIIELCRDLSHNLTFEEALLDQDWPGVLVARADAVGLPTAARRARATAGQLRRIAEVSFEPEAGDLARGFLRAAAEGAFESESGEATDLLRLERQAAPVLRAAAAQRRLQARISAADQPQVTLARFRPGTRHHVEVRISAEDRGWLTAGAAFPEEPVPDGEPRRLVVLLSEPDLLPGPLVHEIVLPAGGSSTTATFVLTTGPATRTVNARVLILSGNRILQTSRLVAGVGDDDGAPAADPARPEALLTAFTPELDDRRTFGAALFIGDDDVTAVAGTTAAEIRLHEGALTNAMDVIRHRLSEAVTDGRPVATLDDPAAVELLVFLAFHGTHIRLALERDAAGFDERLRQARSLQIVSAKPDAFFPFEFTYDFPSPKENAGLCPAAITALGSLDPASGCPGPHTAEVVCPFGFWGVSKVIERHAYRAGVPVDPDFLLHGNPVRDRDRIPLGHSLLAASDRVDAFTAGSVGQVLSALEQSSGSARQVQAWDGWSALIGEYRPALIMMLPHTVFSDVFQAAGLEIGANARVWSAEIDRGWLPAGDQPKIVALLGCETTQAGKIEYERFPSLLRGAGAEIVIGTFTEILGRHAAPVARHLTEELHRFCRDEPHGLGEVMLRLRRRLLADGVLTVLALAAYGDADWLIGGDR